MNEQLTTALTEQLSQRASGDPLMAMLLQQMTSTAADAEPDRESADLRTRLERTTRVVERLRAELAAANAMATYVSRVLGACERCWGMDQFCRSCLGRGHPGSRDPDVTALVEWISPALRRAGLATITRPIDEIAPAPQEGAAHDGISQLGSDR